MCTGIWKLSGSSRQRVLARSLDPIRLVTPTILGESRMPVKYGIIGCGAISQRRHMPECAANRESALIALADPVKERVEELAVKYGAIPFTDYREMLASKDVDAVVVAGPNSSHAAMSIEALNAGKHVLCEKPMATTREDARAMIDAAKKNKKFLMIGLSV